MGKYSLIATNASGESVDLYNDSEIKLVSIDGVSMESNVNLSELIGDGSGYINSRVPSRTISIIARYRDGNVENAKLRLYHIFRPKSEIELRYISPTHDVFIKGYCSVISTPPNVKHMISQITLVCPDPYFKQYGTEMVQLYGLTNMLEFIQNGTEFNQIEMGNSKTAAITTINYSGDTDTGCIFKINVKQVCQNLKITDLGTKKYILFACELIAGDVIILNTKNGEKSAILTRSGGERSLLPYMDIGSSFLQLTNGENKIKISVEGTGAQGIDIYCTYEIMVGGV